MEGLLDLFECVIESPRYGEYIQEFLSSCTEHQAFYKKKSKCVQQFISLTNSRLNEPSDRLEGLLLLQTFLPQCSDQQFIENAVSWMSQCVKGAEAMKCSYTRLASFSVLKMLLEMTKHFQEFTKNVSNIMSKQLFDQLQFTRRSPQVEIAALECVHTLIRNYGAPCTPHKAAIENFVLSVVDRKDQLVIDKASRCFALLPLIGGAGPSGSNHKSRWLEQQKHVCETMHQLLDQLLDGIGDKQIREASEVLPLESIVELNPIVKLHEVANRFINIAKFLEAMLLHEFPVSKSVLPDNILGIVNRGLSTNCTNLGGKGSTDVLSVGSVLPRINVAALRVLNALIKCLGKNLYPQAKLICRLIVQTLKWTVCGNQDYGVPRPYASVRVEACRTLVAWLQVARGGSCVEEVALDLVQVLSQDVSTVKSALKLTVQTKKRKHNATVDDTPTTSQPIGIDASSRIKLVDQTANANTCEAALDALYWMVLTAGVFVKPSLHKTLQEMVLLVLFDVQRSNRNDIPIPYSEAKCRLSLYRLLQILTLEPHSMWPPPTQFTVHVMAQGQADPSSEVSGYCAAALSSVEKLIHPSSRALQCSFDLEEVVNSAGNEATRVVRPLVPQQPVDKEDAASISSEDLLPPPGHFVSQGAASAPDTQVTTTVAEVNDDNLSDASTIQYPNLKDKETHKLDKVMENEPAKRIMNSSFEECDIEDKIPVSSVYKKRRVEGVSNTDLAGPNDVPGKVVDSNKASDNKLSSSAKAKMFQRKASGETSPKLLGGSEISKVTRFNLKPRYVSLADEEDGGSVVNVSSDDELQESNISVVSSNSNYQESILNKSGTTNDRDIFEDIAEENEETVLSIHKSCEDPSEVSISIEKTSSVVLNSNGLPGVGESAAGKNDITTNDTNGEPAVKKAKNNTSTDNKVRVPSNIEGLTDEEVVQFVLDDFKQTID